MLFNLYLLVIFKLYFIFYFQKLYTKLPKYQCSFYYLRFFFIASSSLSISDELEKGDFFFIFTDKTISKENEIDS